MSDRPPWVKPAISFGIPLLAVVVALPYLTGHGYGFGLPSRATIEHSWHDTRQSVAKAVAGEAAGGTGAKVRFYECRSASGKVLSSEPCGPAARIHDVDPNAVNHFQPPPAPTASPAVAVPPAATAHDSSPVAILNGVRSDLAAAQSLDEQKRATAERDAQ